MSVPQDNNDDDDSCLTSVSHDDNDGDSILTSCLLDR